MNNAQGTLSFPLPPKYRSDPPSFVIDAKSDTINELASKDLSCATSADYLAQTYKGAQVDAVQYGEEITVNVSVTTTQCDRGWPVFTTDGGTGMNHDALKKATGADKYSFTGSCLQGPVLWGGQSDPTQFTKRTGSSTDCTIEITDFPEPVQPWTGTIN